jgi:hypothetical protein
MGAEPSQIVVGLSVLSFGMRLNIFHQSNREFLKLWSPANNLKYTSKLPARKASKSSSPPLPVDVEIVG